MDIYKLVKDEYFRTEDALSTVAQKELAKIFGVKPKGTIKRILGISDVIMESDVLTKKQMAQILVEHGLVKSYKQGLKELNYLLGLVPGHNIRKYGHLGFDESDYVNKHGEKGYRVIFTGDPYPLYYSPCMEHLLTRERLRQLEQRRHAKFSRSPWRNLMAHNRQPRAGIAAKKTGDDIINGAQLEQRYRARRADRRYRTREQLD